MLSGNFDFLLILGSLLSVFLLSGRLVTVIFLRSEDYCFFPSTFPLPTAPLQPLNDVTSPSCLFDSLDIFWHSLVIILAKECELLDITRTPLLENNLLRLSKQITSSRVYITTALTFIRGGRIISPPKLCAGVELTCNSHIS